MQSEFRGRRPPVFAWLALALACLVPVSVGAQSSSEKSDKSASQDQSAKADKSSDSKDSDQSDSTTTRLRIEITDPNDKPVANASVYVRFNQTGGPLQKDKLVELNLKTNEDGSVKVPGIPQGKVMIQVIAKGWHTFGKWYDINKSEETVQIKLQNPPHWY